MASKFLVTDIVDPVKAPITEIGLRHINAMPQEIGDALVKALIGTYTTDDLIVLSGCVVTVLSGSVPGTGTASLSAGYVYRNGEVFQVDAIALLTTTANTLVWVADDELRDSVQTKFSDANDYDFLRVAKLKLEAGASLSGIVDFDAATVKSINRTVVIGGGATAYVSNRIVTITFTIGTTAGALQGVTLFTIPASLRTLVNRGMIITATCYIGGGGAAQYNLTTQVNVQTATGLVTLGLDMPPSTDVIVGTIVYTLD